MLSTYLLSKMEATKNCTKNYNRNQFFIISGYNTTATVVKFIREKMQAVSSSKKCDN